MARQEYTVGDQVVDARDGRERRKGRIEGVAKLIEDGRAQPFYRVDFGRYELHLTAGEIAPATRR